MDDLDRDNLIDQLYKEQKEQAKRKTPKKQYHLMCGRCSRDFIGSAPNISCCPSCNDFFQSKKVLAMQLQSGRCSKHPKYNAKKPPQCICETCWLVWFNKNHCAHCEGSGLY